MAASLSYRPCTEQAAVVPSKLVPRTIPGFTKILGILPIVVDLTFVVALTDVLIEILIALPQLVEAHLVTQSIIRRRTVGENKVFNSRILSSVTARTATGARGVRLIDTHQFLPFL